MLINPGNGIRGPLSKAHALALCKVCARQQKQHMRRILGSFEHRRLIYASWMAPSQALNQIRLEDTQACADHAILP